MGKRDRIASKELPNERHRTPWPADLRALVASEVLFLEFLTLAAQQGWTKRAAEVVLARARSQLWHLLQSRRSHLVLPTATVGEALGHSSPDNDAGDPAPLKERLDAAIRTSKAQLRDARRMTRRAQAGELTMAEVRLQAEQLLAAYAKSAWSLPSWLVDDIDQKLAHEHRQCIANGGAAPAGPSSDLSRQGQLHIGPYAITGLAISGGGVRSASFAIGALHELNRGIPLRTFDIMSGVSGGSWALGWLAAWAHRHRHGLDGVGEVLLRSHHDGIPPLRWVRRYITYMVTRPGWASGDSWALVAAYFANWLPIVTLTGVMVLLAAMLPHALAASAIALDRKHGSDLNGAMLAAAVVATWLFLSLLRRLTLYYREPGDRERQSPGLRNVVILLAVTSAVGLCMMAPEIAHRMQIHQNSADGIEVGAVVRMAIVWLVLSILTVLTAHVLALKKVQQLGDRLRRRLWNGKLVESGSLQLHVMSWRQDGMGLVIMVALCSVLTTWLLQQVTHNELTPAWRIGVGPIVLMCAVAVAELGASLTIQRADVHRAWAARVGGWVMAGIAAWSLLAVCSLGITSLIRTPSFRVHVVFGVVAFLALAIALGWLLTPGLRQRHHALTLAVTLASCLLLLPLAAGSLARTAQGEIRGVWTIWGTFISLGLGLWMLHLLCNVNRHSLHTVYKQGLVRTFLGASRASLSNPDVRTPAPAAAGAGPGDEDRQFRRRRPQPATNIDDDDNPALAWLNKAAQGRMPLLLINAAVNGDSLRDKEGRAPRQWPFTFSQEFTGSPAEGIGYAPTSRFNSEDPTHRLTLGTAMAVSGAAVSPISGASTRPLRAFLLGLLNARLGMWIGNPHHPQHVVRARPNRGGWSVLREILGLRADIDKSIHLSDGGHFENLGIYELVRRGCSRIVAIDATCDPDLEYADLAHAIQRARIDLNVDIYAKGGMRMGAQSPDAPPWGRGVAAHRCWMWLVIDYGPKVRPGLLLYIKPMMLGHLGLQAEVMNYAREAPTFPHESTLNQLFSEKTFEAYRQLGEACMRDAMETVLQPGRMSGDDSDHDKELHRLVLRRA